MADPKLIDSKHNKLFTHNGMTVELCIYQLEDTKWKLEAVDENGTSVVWDGEFDSNDDAHAEFLKSVATEGLDGIFRDTARMNKYVAGAIRKVSDPQPGHAHDGPPRKRTFASIDRHLARLS